MALRLGKLHAAEANEKHSGLLSATYDADRDASGTDAAHLRQSSAFSFTYDAALFSRRQNEYLFSDIHQD